MELPSLGAIFSRMSKVSLSAHTPTKNWRISTGRPLNIKGELMTNTTHRKNKEKSSARSGSISGEK